ncbi:right-handed parallel beta-helix repeat-containing protein [Herbiconiux sp. CPCC 205716]|uniref:Right-handed parallel beta-helix repeat-containing protein n=1 Tax=Herbiconiux gentiana TaxID=2970912 RepID=A0ABT2GGH4_9MICO|nr:right-handed parallel beta-helix repeat-containing protein [Herbiconiux gentiana]MCS5715315.1 right-handed parallel beta-helix repeat-containing protein [Herbiconiux gentiana]
MRTHPSPPTAPGSAPALNRRDLLRAGLLATPVVAAGLVWSPSSAPAQAATASTQAKAAAASTQAQAAPSGPVTSVLEHGAGPDRTGAQNATAFADAVAAVAEQGGGTVDFSDLPLAFDGALHMPPNVSARGGGIITFGDGAKWIYGSGHDSTSYASSVRGIRFTRSLASSDGLSIPKDSVFLQLEGCRDLTISGCAFHGAEVAISQPAAPALPNHANSMIVISGNHFSEVDYAWKASRHQKSKWGVNSDSVFSDNIVNHAYVTHVHCDSIDGVTVTGNVFFFPGHEESKASGPSRIRDKLHNVFIGESNWVHVHDNNCFEAGADAIRLEDARTANVTGNNIAWPGQVTPADGIAVTGNRAGETLKLVVASNQITFHTRHAVSVTGPAQAVGLGPDTVFFLADPPTYFGTVDLGSDDDHHRYFVDDSVSVLPTIASGASIRPGESDRLPSITGTGLTSFTVLGALGATAAASTTADFSSGATTATFSCQSTARGTTAYGGLVVVTARRHAADGSPAATYLLLVSKAPAPGGAATIESAVLVSAAGCTDGSTSEHPSFTWTLAGDRLVATAFGSTRGAGFRFDAVATGDLLLS